MLITRENILCRFSDNLEWATRIDLATAWVTPNESLCALQHRTPRPKVRAVVGLQDNITKPNALRKLVKIGELKRPRNGPFFHPKVYIFRGGDKSVAWIGSANFTAGGFERHVEILFETSDTEDVASWFNRLWEEQCDPLDEYEINRYDNWRKRNPPPPPSPHPKFTGWTPPASWWKEEGRRASLLTFYLCRPGGIAWSDVVSKAKKYNDMQYPKLKKSSEFTDSYWRNHCSAHAKSWVKTSREKGHIPEFQSIGDGECGKLVLKSGRPLRPKKLIELIDLHKNHRG